MSYIWDEWSDDETQTLPSYNSITKKSIQSEDSKTKLNKLEEILDTYEKKINNYSSYSSINDDQYGDSPSVVSGASSLSSLGFESFVSTPYGRDSSTDIIQNFTSKIKHIKEQIKQANDEAKQIQASIFRLQTVKERKQLKINEEWEKTLLNLTSKFNQELQDIQAFKDKVLSDTRKHQRQQSDLYQKLEIIANDKENMLEVIRNENERKLVQAKKQWEADEKVQIEKQLALKKASLQSHAASLWAPQLESLHKNFKEKLSTIEKEQANSIEKLKIKLEKENFNELTKETNDINKEYYDKINKIEDENKKMLEEYERKYEEEIKNLKIKHENEKDLITQQFDSLLLHSSDSHTKLIQSLTLSHQEQENELNNTIKNEYKKIKEEFDQKFAEAEKSYKLSLEKVIESCKTMHKNQLLDIVEWCKNYQDQLIDDQKEEIINKLKHEEEIKRNEFKAMKYDELNSIKKNIDNKNNNIHLIDAALNKSKILLISDISNLNSKISILTDEEIPALKYKINDELKNKKIKLQSTLDSYTENVNKEITVTKTEEEEKFLNLEKEVNVLLSRLTLLQNEIPQLNETLRREREDKEKDFENELKRIEEKIEIVLEKREDTVRKYKNQYEELLLEISKKEETLQELREDYYNKNN